MAGTAQRIRLRLFLEGIEVPVVGATVMSVPNATLQAQIQIPPLNEATKLLPRTLVHLYFLDFYEAASTLIQPGITDSSVTNSRNPTIAELQREAADQQSTLTDQGTLDESGISSDIATDLRNDRWKLLFGGEMVGFQWVKNVNSRSLVLICQGWSNYWDYAYQWNNTDLFGPGVKAVFSGGATNLFTDFLSSKAEAITNVLNTPSKQYPNMKGVLGGIIHLLEAVGGSYYHEDKIIGQNLFFSVAELRLHLSQMISALENDPTTSKLIRNHGFGGMFSRLLGGLGGQVSIRSTINALTKVIFHEMYEQPCPYYTPGSETGVSGVKRVPLLGNPDPRLNALAIAAQRLRSSVIDVRTNISRPVEDNPELAIPEFASGLRTLLARNMRKFSNDMRTVARQASGDNLQAVRGLFGTAATSANRAATLIAQNWRPNAPERTITRIQTELEKTIDALNRITEVDIVVTPPNARVPARLHMNVFRPDIWFSSPPRCNVIFPEGYYQLTYERMYLQEPTRFLLKTNDEFFGEDALFDNLYFAPKASQGVKQDRAYYRDVLKRDLLDHEQFTGILPVFEKMGEFNVFASASGTVRSELDKVGFAQRTVNFLYFKYRFNARKASFIGKFNPYVAVGFPGLIIDRPVDLDALFNRLQAFSTVDQSFQPDPRASLGPNFLGNFTEVTHIVSQTPEKGETRINLSYPRQPDESVEFLVPQGDRTTITRREGSDARRSTDVAALTPPNLLQQGPNLGEITRIDDVTNIYARRSGDANRLPLFGGKKRQATGETRTQVPIGVSVLAGDLGPEVIDAVGGNVPVVFRAYRIEEQVPRYRREIVSLPAEEFIRPGFYGDVWHPHRISEAYNEFLGIGSISDPQEISLSGGRSIGFTDEQTQEAVDELGTAGATQDPRALAATLLSLENNSSIEQAVSFLVATYSYVKSAGLDVDEFIRAYTWRPIASLVDMFGTADLALTDDGTTVVQGIEGFHSRAFGPFSDLFGLVTAEINDILGITRNTAASARADTRGRKQEAVREVRAALDASVGLLG